MNTMAVLALVWAWVLGLLIVAALWPRDRSLRADAPLILPLGALLGLAATSVIFFFSSLVFARTGLIAGVVELVLAIVLARAVSRRPRTIPPPGAVVSLGWLHLVIATVVVQMALVAVILAARSYRAEPYGGWDGWAIWNLHARMLLRAGPSWTRLLDASQLNWTHPDYPLLVSASVARVWAWTGAESPFASGLVSGIFAAATVAILVAAVAKIRHSLLGLVGGLLLVATPFFVTFSTNEHADIPLAAFMLAAVALALSAQRDAQDHGFRVLAGFCAAAAAWTKNEGLLFALVFTGVWICGSRDNEIGLRGIVARSRYLERYLFALAIGLLPVAFFKFFLAPSGDLLSGGSIGGRLEQLFEVSRHRMILSALWRDLARFGEWATLPYLAMALPFLAWNSRRRLAMHEMIAPLVLLLMLVGYYAVYLLTPQDLAWHLEGSLVRLLLQLWPIGVLCWCLTVPSIEFPSAAARSSKITLGIFAAVNAAVALVLGLTLAHQPAANELAFRRRAGAEIAVTPGDGWFAIERHERTVWIWSRGNATLHVQAAPGGATSPITIRFALRSLAPRQITVRLANRVLWQGSVDAEKFVPVEISNLTLPTENNAFEFTTDAPGTPETTTSDARRLAFAIYDLRIR